VAVSCACGVGDKEGGRFLWGGRFRFFRAAYEAVVKRVVCANSGGERFVCEWWGEEGGVMNSAREERTRVSAVHEVGGEVKRGLLQTCSRRPQ
jgi:hypothetical protein